MYQVLLVDHFLGQLKSYLKKYRGLDEDLIRTLEAFIPEISVPLGNRLYKVRLRSRSVAKGKSGSFRIIVYLLEVDRLLVPVTLYFKGDQADISKQEIEYHLSMVLAEVERRK